MNFIKPFVIALTAITGFVSCLTAHAELANGKFGSAQAFDAQRSPAFPTVGNPITYSNFANPYADPGGQFVMTAGQYLQFTKVSDVPCRYSATVYNSNNTVARVMASSGSIWGIGNLGFLFASLPGDYGTFVASGTGYSLGGSITFTATTAEATCVETAAYVPSTTPVSTPGPITPPIAQSIPTLSEWGMIILSGLLALGTLVVMRRRQM
jgi:hypothetical protein